MDKETSLSDKRKTNEQWKPEKDFSFYWEEDVREAVRRLVAKIEKKTCIHPSSRLVVIRMIIKEFGEKLTFKQEGAKG